MTTDSTGNKLGAGRLDLSRLQPPHKLAAGSMIAVAIAVFLPWVSLAGISVGGLRGDGKITFVCATAGLAAIANGTRLRGAPRLTRQQYFMISGIAAGLSVYTGLQHLTSYSGIGVYLTLFGGLAWAAALLWEHNAEKARGLGA